MLRVGQELLNVSFGGMIMDHVEKAVFGMVATATVLKTFSYQAHMAVIEKKQSIRG